MNESTRRLWSDLLTAVVLTAVLALIGFCSMMESRQIAGGIPVNLPYEKVLANRSTISCVFLAYRLTEAAARELRDDPSVASRLSMDPVSGRAYSQYRQTPTLFKHRGYGGDDPAKTNVIYALDADGGCGDASFDLPYAGNLLKEPGNLYAVDESHEGLSIISPQRRLALFLAFD